MVNIPVTVKYLGAGNRFDVFLGRKYLGVIDQGEDGLWYPVNYECNRFVSPQQAELALLFQLGYIDRPEWFTDACKRK